ncbi:Oidioi.mRNA.OKI2018_I69.XSR.g15761.t1.cds [Oikopleura dioica]|uniref:Oidioi.mRNA.OKI2018_I69.XSR.g15761.t1.cds n=1 Tax=Oikopleura dioica TaxID=34765 RepID=A0ABN7SHW5_OIKDI|nr:Oidioi.mRNA.OKI2018_I69.XSR.g15761.t1.cds [Oikopleura dioica]
MAFKRDSKKILETKGVQYSPVKNAVDSAVDLESSQPNDAYWKSLAEEREKALNETLEENKSLCEIMEVRQQELEELAVENAELTEENRLLADKAASLSHFEKIIAELTNEIA